MDFAFDERTEELRTTLLGFMESHVHPAEPVFHEQLAALDDPCWAAEQQERWLVPLLEGRIRSSFAMTEPDVAAPAAPALLRRERRRPPPSSARTPGPG